MSSTVVSQWEKSSEVRDEVKKGQQGLDVKPCKSEVYSKCNKGKAVLGPGSNVM